MATSKATSSKGKPATSTAPKSGRVQRQHRATGQARREALLDAAMEVIASSGMAGVTHRAVTEAAGVPLATVSYFFDSITDLATEAIRVSSQRRIDELHQLVERAQAQSQSPETEDLSRQLAANRMPLQGVQAMVEIYLAAGRMPQMRDCAAGILDSVTDFATVALRAAGAPEPESMARAFVALADGYSLHSMASADGLVDSEDHVTATRALFLGYLVLQGHADKAKDIAATRTEKPRPTTARRRRKAQ